MLLNNRYKSFCKSGGSYSLLSTKLKEHPKFLNILACNSEGVGRIQLSCYHKTPSVPITYPCEQGLSTLSYGKFKRRIELMLYYGHANKDNINPQRDEIIWGEKPSSYP